MKKIKKQNLDKTIESDMILDMESQIVLRFIPVWSWLSFKY